MTLAAESVWGTPALNLNEVKGDVGMHAASLIAPLAGDIAIVAAYRHRLGRLDARGADLAAGRTRPQSRIAWHLPTADRNARYELQEAQLIL